MKEQLAQWTAEVGAVEFNTADEVEAFRIQWLGRKGKMKDVMADFKAAPNDQKRELGKLINEFKQLVEQRVAEGAKSQIQASSDDAPQFDWTRPDGGIPVGAHHPLSVVRRDIIGILERMGFVVSEGPEIEDDWHVFSGLNFPEEHPARDMQDTFFVDRNPDMLLRTHTSSVQVREMEKREPPMRIIMPGRVFRNEAISARAHCMFHQIEGLYIDKGVSFADLKQTLLRFAQEFFGADTKIRLRPSYFPFTEPSAEVDVYWGLETEVDKRITKGTGWLEILGCGMVDPAVLEASGIDSREYSGFAFGMGVERITMLKYQIGDLRAFFESDMRFLEQFQGQR
ncbi:MAG: phenylalanine--tRNA ligase subunit alpha [Flavobacteriales bacterium]|nr:phenylalanine--tRNA ligase subunit alpha [Crocinitomicaceae bacterium]MBO75783.1 phenylalanine--tRNA ligase subunit alpha [Flavobacteriales bacterium]